VVPPRLLVPSSWFRTTSTGSSDTAGSERVAARCRTWGSPGFPTAWRDFRRSVGQTGVSRRRITLQRFPLVSSRTRSPGPLPSCRSSSVPLRGRTSLRSSVTTAGSMTMRRPRPVSRFAA
jgi:hypothetical protein